MSTFLQPEMEFKELEPRFKSAKIRFKLIAGLNLETFDTISVEPTIFKPRIKFKPLLKFFKFGCNVWCKLRLFDLTEFRVCDKGSIIYIDNHFRNFSIKRESNHSILAISIWECLEFFRIREAKILRRSIGSGSRLCY